MSVDMRTTIRRQPSSNRDTVECWRCGGNHFYRDKRTSRVCTAEPTLDPIRVKRFGQSEQKQNAAEPQSRAQSFFARAFPSGVQPQAQSQSYSAVVGASAPECKEHTARLTQIEAKQAESEKLIAELQHKQAQNAKENVELKQKLAEGERQIMALQQRQTEITQAMAEINTAISEAKITAEQHTHAINAQVKSVECVKTNYLRYSLDVQEQIRESLMRHAENLRNLSLRFDNTDKQMSVIKALFVSKSSGAASSSTQLAPTASANTQQSLTDSERQFRANLQAGLSGKPKAGASDISTAHDSKEKPAASTTSVIAQLSPSRSASAPLSPRVTRSSRRQLLQPITDQQSLQPVNFTNSPIKTAKKKAKARQAQQQSSSVASEEDPRGGVAESQNKDKGKQLKTSVASVSS